MRAWFFQSQAASKSAGGTHLWSGARDWTLFDRTLALAQQKGIRVIATLTDQAGECGDGPTAGYKTDTWYGGPLVGGVRDASQAGYKIADPMESALSAPAHGYDNWVSYRGWVQEVVGRYANHPEILAWQLINEGEAKTASNGSCPADATAVMTAWAADVSTVIRSVDPNHLISLGTLGTGQCGASFTQYSALHALPNIDLCEFHDYTPGQDMPGDSFNGLQLRISQCNALGKPIFVGEVGIKPADAGGTLQGRADRLRSKIVRQSGAGLVGHLSWNYNQRFPGTTLDGFDIGSGDPALSVLAQARSGAVWSSVRVGVTSPGGEVPTGVDAPMISNDGQHVMFMAADSALSVAGSGDYQVFVRDLGNPAKTEQVSVDNSGLGGDRRSWGGGLSSDGQLVVFVSYATLSPDDLNGYVSDVYVRDRTTQTTELVSVSSTGVQGNGPSGEGGGAIADVSISADGRWVLFTSQASNLVPGDTNGVADVFLRDRVNHTTERVSVATGGSEANAASTWIKISADGTTASFTSPATNLVPGDTNGVADAFVHNRVTGATERVSLGPSGSEANGATFYPVGLSADGSVVAFISDASNLVPGDTNAAWDTFVRDRIAGTTERVSVATTGAQGTDFSEGVAINSDGTMVVFATRSSLAPEDANGDFDVYVRNRLAATTELVSRTPSGVAGSGGVYLNGLGVDVDGSGKAIAFHSAGSNLVPGDTNNTLDAFVARSTVTVTPVTRPGAPTAVTAAAGPETASISWIAPTDDGGSPITGYTITPYPSGQPLTVSGATTTATMGLVDDTAYTFTVAATNAVGTGVPSAASSPVTPRANASPPTTVAEVVPVEGTITTDPANSGPTPSAPVTAAVTVPDGGVVTIAVADVSVSPPAGFTFLGQQVVINAPSATAAAPLTLSFTLDGSLVAGIPLSEIKVVRTEGATQQELTSCSGALTATPDPCVADRSLVGGDVQITVLTSSASTWNLAVDTLPPVVTIDGVSRPFIGATGMSTVTWHASENGAYSVQLGGADCASGTTLTSGTYGNTPSLVLVPVQAAVLAIGPNAIRVCDTDAALNTGSAVATIVKDTTAPSAVSISLVGPSPTNAASVAWRVTFSEPVTGVGAGNFSLLQLGLGTAPAITDVAGSGITWTVTASSGAGDWVTLLNLVSRTGIADLAGNPLTNTLVGKIYQIDRVAPTIGVTRPAAGAVYTLGSTVSASYACGDEFVGSGIASCIGTTSNGASIDTASVGPKTFTVVAVDRAGNSTTRTVSYSVSYAFSGFFGSVANPPALNSIKGGLSVPVIFSLSGNRGLAILAAGSPSNQPINCTTHAPIGTSTHAVGSLAYSTGTGRYTYTWQTSAAWAGTCEQLTLVLNDGTSHIAYFRLTK